MVWGQHVAHCGCCGSQFICGDCIPMVCSRCLAEKHNGGSILFCPVCIERREKRVESMKQMIADARIIRSDTWFSCPVETDGSFGDGVFE